MNGALTETLQKKKAEYQSNLVREKFSEVVQHSQYVGEVYSISFDSALVEVHDRFRKTVGGISSLSFLVATRVLPQSEGLFSHEDEDSSLILLRVLDSAPLPQDTEALRIRTAVAQQVTGEMDQHWDDPRAMDYQSAHIFSFSGIKCRVLGTFYLDNPAGGKGSTENLYWRFGSDLSNYYPNRGLKVFKPNDTALSTLVNYQSPERRDELKGSKAVEIGRVRYGSTNRNFQGIHNVGVNIFPADLLSQKTALFGMTRVGKSNTVKVIASAVFDLRKGDKSQRIGQLIFDPNGEYANDNVQDENSGLNPSSLKNVGKSENNAATDVVTYGLRPHRNDPYRKLMLINFYDRDSTQIGKDLIDSAVDAKETSQYIKNFRDVSFDLPIKDDFDDESSYQSAQTRYKRRVLAYHSLLAYSGYQLPVSLKKAVLTGLFKADLLKRMKEYEGNATGNQDTVKIKAASAILEKDSVEWAALPDAFEGLFLYLKTSDYATWNMVYIRGSTSGQAWADKDLISLLEMFTRLKGTNYVLRQVRGQHSANVSGDYGDAIYNDLRDGKMVIVDLSGEDDNLAKSVSERMMSAVFRKNQAIFKDGKVPPEILIYIEEAHNLLPAGSDEDLKDIWVRTAKEGGKYHIGMVYATQEVSSIQSNILKNTANWLIGHLNNTDETRVLERFYDFGDFCDSIIRAQDRGFLRVKTLSNLFTVPVQIHKFEV